MKVFEAIFTYLWGHPSKLIPIISGTSGNFTNVITRAKFHFDRLRGFGGAGARKSYVSVGEQGRT
jgi:hypothetical protein